MSIFSKKKDKWDDLPDDGGDTKKTTIDGEPVESLRQWAAIQLQECRMARDQESALTIKSTQSSSSFIERIKSNHRYYVALSQQLKIDGVIPDESPEELLVENDIMKYIRGKVSVLTHVVPVFKYEELDAVDTDVINGVNQIKHQRLEVEGYEESYNDSILKRCCYGSCIRAYEYSRAFNEPEGGCFIEVLDPLACTWKYGKSKIEGNNVADPTRSKIFIVVRPRSKCTIEREWEKKVVTGSDLVDLKHYNLMYALRGHHINRISDTDDIPEIRMWIEDETTIPVEIKKPLTRPVKDEKGKPLFDNELNPITEPDLDDDGEQRFELVRTGKRRMKYPNGRLIVFAGKTICYDGNNPNDHGERPYFKTDNVKSPVGFWGISDPEICASGQRALVKMNNATYQSIKNMPGIMFLNAVKMMDKNKPIEKIGGWLIGRLKKDTDPRSVSHLVQPVAVTQDQLLFQRERQIKMQDSVGSQNVVYGRANASDSGIKVAELKQSVVDFHGPIMKDETTQIKRLGRIFFSNLRQYNQTPQLYKTVGRDQKPEATLFAGAFLSDDFPFNVVIDIYRTSLRDEMLGKLIDIKGVVPEMPGSILYKYSGVPELAELAQLEAQNQAEVIAILEKVNATGKLDELLQVIGIDAGGQQPGADA